MIGVENKYNFTYKAGKAAFNFGALTLALGWGLADARSVHADVSTEAGIQHEHVVNRPANQMNVTESFFLQTDADNQTIDHQDEQDTSTDDEMVPMDSDDIIDAKVTPEEGGPSKPPVTSSENLPSTEPSKQTGTAPTERVEQAKRPQNMQKQIETTALREKTPTDTETVPSVSQTTVSQVADHLPIAVVGDLIDDWMPDRNLQQIVLHQLQRDQDISSVNQITKALVSKMTILFSDPTYELNNRAYHEAVIGIQSLKGLEYAVQLERLNIFPEVGASFDWDGQFMHGNLFDISALAHLSKLYEVTLQINQLTDISALSQLTLTNVALDNNRIYDLSPLKNSAANLSPLSALSDQLVTLPKVILNANTTDFTLTFGVTNIHGESVPVSPEETSEDFFNSTGTGTNVDTQTITWRLNESEGQLLLKWSVGSGQYLFTGEVCIPYEMSNTVGNVAVNFKNRDGSVLAPQLTLAGTLGEKFDLSNMASVNEIVHRLAQKGYAVVGTENNVATTGTYAEKMTYVTFLFDVKPVQTTLNFLNEQGEQISKPQILSGKPGEQWQTAIPALKGYVFQKIKQKEANVAVSTDQLSGTYVADSAIDLVYKAQEESATIHYVYANGKQAAPQQVVTGKYGENITFPDSPTIAGYTASQLLPASFGDGEGANSFTVIYTRQKVTAPAETVPPTDTTNQNITVTVHYQTATGIPVAPDDRLIGKVGEPYRTRPATNVTTGYRLVTTPINATGTLGQSNVTVTYIYARIATENNQSELEPMKPLKPAFTAPAADPDEPIGHDVMQMGTADTVAIGGAAGGMINSLPRHPLSDQATKRLPKTNEKTRSPWWGIALLSVMFSLVGIGWHRGRKLDADS